MLQFAGKFFQNVYLSNAAALKDQEGKSTFNFDAKVHEYIHNVFVCARAECVCVIECVCISE
jgi:hypothetical protein